MLLTFETLKSWYEASYLERNIFFFLTTHLLIFWCNHFGEKCIYGLDKIFVWFFCRILAVTDNKFFEKL